MRMRNKFSFIVGRHTTLSLVKLNINMSSKIETLALKFLLHRNSFTQVSFTRCGRAICGASARAAPERRRPRARRRMYRSLTVKMTLNRCAHCTLCMHICKDGTFAFGYGCLRVLRWLSMRLGGHVLPEKCFDSACSPHLTVHPLPMRLLPRRFSAYTCRATRALKFTICPCASPYRETVLSCWQQTWLITSHEHLILTPQLQPDPNTRQHIRLQSAVAPWKLPRGHAPRWKGRNTITSIGQT